MVSGDWQIDGKTEEPIPSSKNFCFCEDKRCDLEIEWE